MRIGVLLAVAMIAVVATQGNSRRDRFKPNGVVDNEGPANGGQNPTEAPAGFDNQTNGMDPQGPDYETLNEDTVVPLRSFNDNRFVFEEIETAGDGVGPTYNAQSCRECHQNVVTTNKMRTAPLWALRTRNRLMHDGLAFTKEEAIQRHRGQADQVRQRFDALTSAEKQQLMRFLESL
jgi:hypothetical protein